MSKKRGKSIRAKLLLLGFASVIATLILGFTGIYLINSNNKNNEVLSRINTINVLQNSNQAAEISFLYNLDNSYNDTIKSNLNTMSEASNIGKLKDIKKDIDNNLNNTNSLIETYNTRGLSSDTGKYAEFMSYDAKIQKAFETINSESEWVDGSWSEIPVGSMELVNIDGTTYRHYTYHTKMPLVGKRDYVVLRFGNNGLNYSGHFAISNLKINDSVVVDFSKLDEKSLANSYGSGFKTLELGKLADEATIEFDSTFDGNNSDWQEASIEIPVVDYEIENGEKQKLTFEFWKKDKNELPNFVIV